MIVGLFLLGSVVAYSQRVTVVSPNQKISIALYNQQNADAGEWHLKVNYINNGKICEATSQITLGLSRSDQDFSNALTFLKTGKPLLITDQYSVLHGKRAHCSNSANEVVVSFENPSFPI
jgi:hypothetical protein